MSALTPEEFRLLSESKRVRTLSDEFDRGWQQITQERDSKIQLVIHAE